MGEPIRRKTLAAIAREYERDGRVAPWQPEAPKEFNPGAVFFGVNYSQTPIMPGDRIKVESFAPVNIGYAVAYKRILKNKIKFWCRPWDDEQDQILPEQPITIRALTPAAQDHICQFIIIPGNAYFANIYFPDGTKTSYATYEGVGTNDKDSAFAYVEITSLLSDADQSGGKYGVALCTKIETGGLSLEEVDDEIDATLAEKTTTIRYISSTHFAVSTDGYLTITSASTSKTVYAP